MRKIFKIIIALFAVLVVGFALFGAVVFLDLSAYTAGASQTLTPSGISVGNALVVYNPGLSGAAKGVAEKVASELQGKGYTVMLAGVKSGDASDLSGKQIIVVGGPVYAGALTVSVKEYLNNLIPDSSAKVGVFGSGGGAQEGEDIALIRGSVKTLQDGGALQNSVVVKIGTGEDLSARVADFVNQLTKLTLDT